MLLLPRQDVGISAAGHRAARPGTAPDGWPLFWHLLEHCNSNAASGL